MERVQGRTELERRDKYIRILEAEIGGLHPSLVWLIKQCLHNVPNQRPNTSELLNRLQTMKRDVEKQFRGSPDKLDEVRTMLAELNNRRIGEQQIRNSKGHSVAKTSPLTTEVTPVQPEPAPKEPDVANLLASFPGPMLVRGAWGRGY